MAGLRSAGSLVPLDTSLDSSQRPSEVRVILMSVERISRLLSVCQALSEWRSALLVFSIALLQLSGTSPRPEDRADPRWLGQSNCPSTP